MTEWLVHFLYVSCTYAAVTPSSAHRASMIVASPLVPMYQGLNNILQGRALYHQGP